MPDYGRDHPEWLSIAINYGRNPVSAVLSLRESLHQENSPIKNLGKVHHTVKWQKIYFLTFGLFLQKESFDPKILEKNHPHHDFFKMTGSAISGLAVTNS